ncbi:MAG TPA: hypothetical protein VGR19_05055 [Allosphingosinicella sp.]|nr:hypothetical protein [Allosphingosinicella sp.]
MTKQQDAGPASNGSLASGTYNDQGNLTGADSPAGGNAPTDSAGEGQGDDLADRLGGGQGGGAGASGAGASTGDMDAGSSEASDAPASGTGGPDAGSPGGMGGARSQGGASGGSGRPPGGVSPMQSEEGEK